MTEVAVPAPLAVAEDEAARLALELGIPPCPAILLRFSDEMHRDEPDLRRIAGFIGKDVALSAAMLSTVNSPFYGLSRKAANVQQALSILGLRAGANLVTALLLRNAFPSSSGALMQRFWEDSAQLAEIAADIAGEVKAVNRDDAHTYTLFRDCGMAVMISQFRDYGEVLDLHASRPSPELILAEESRYRFNHARVGYALARGWLLPEPLCKSILFHHHIAQVAAGVAETEAADPGLVAFGLLTEQVFALRSGRGLRPDWPASEAFVLHALRLAPEQIVSMGQHERIAA